MEENNSDASESRKRSRSEGEEQKSARLSQKRSREKQRRNEFKRALDEMTEVLYSIEPSLQSGAFDSSGNGDEILTNRSQLISFATKLVRRLHKENKELREIVQMQQNQQTTSSAAAAAQRGGGTTVPSNTATPAMTGRHPQQSMIYRSQISHHASDHLLAPSSRLHPTAGVHSSLSLPQQHPLVATPIRSNSDSFVGRLPKSNLSPLDLLVASHQYKTSGMTQEQLRTNTGMPTLFGLAGPTLEDSSHPRQREHHLLQNYQSLRITDQQKNNDSQQGNPKDDTQQVKNKSKKKRN